MWVTKFLLTYKANIHDFFVNPRATNFLKDFEIMKISNIKGHVTKNV